MDKPLSEFCLAVRVYIEDTDAGAIVFYVNYLKYMERARTECLRALGFGKNEILAEEALFVVHSMQVDYKHPAVLDDVLEVEANIMQLKRTSIIFRQNIYRADTVICTATVKIACINKAQMRPSPMPDRVYQSILHHLRSQE